jgi:hypothetical protein
MGRLTITQSLALDPDVRYRMSVEGVPLAKPDIVGGLEIRQFPTYSSGLWRITWNAEQVFSSDFSVERKRNAVALRALIIDIRPDWTGMQRTESGRLVMSEDERPRFTRLRQLVRGVTDRRAYGECLLCGLRAHDGRDCRKFEDWHPTRLTEEDVAWAR